MFVLAILSCTSGDINEDMMNSEALKPDSNKKITICHKDNQTISISVNALQAHLDHGDKIGPCGSTYVPDDNFEDYLEANGMGDGIERNDFVYTSNIEMVTRLDVDNLFISDLTGIEDFTSLTGLYCYSNQLKKLDLSQNTALLYLFCYDNELKELNVSQNTALLYLFCRDNELEKNALDISQNKDLVFLYTQRNELEELDISQNTALEILYCQSNLLTCIQKGDNPLANLSTVNTGGEPINIDCEYPPIAEE